jgi:hypothetical protein
VFIFHVNLGLVELLFIGKGDAFPKKIAKYKNDKTHRVLLGTAGH